MYAHQALHRRTMTKIQRYIVKRGKRNTISRFFHAKNDREVIAAWKLDLNEIRHVFNVRSITSVRRLLTFRFQTRLDLHTSNTGVAEVRHEGVEELVDGRRTASDVQHNTLKIREGANRAVSTVYSPSLVTELLLIVVAA